LSNHQSQDLTIGWTGTHTTMHYLDELVPVLKRLEQSYAFTFLVISNQSNNYDLKSLKFVKWNKETEIEDLAKINIGVMPLKKDIWSEGKCGFKGLQYMALEIPTIMSPVGVNSTIVQNGINGYLVEKQEEWYEVLEKLILDEHLRIQIGKAGKKRIDEAYSVLANQEKYLNLFV
jgi:glycosyltransferase involved in cell wall biosynthesis